MKHHSKITVLLNPNAVVQIFEQARANGGDYKEPPIYRTWPINKDSWLRKRLAEVRADELDR